MSSNNPYKAFVRRYLARSALGISVGLAAVAPAAAHPASGQNEQGQTTAQSFAERLSRVRSAVSENLKDSERLAQIGLPGGAVRPPPGTVDRPFPNFGKAAFQDSWKNFDNSFANVPRK